MKKVLFMMLVAALSVLATLAMSAQGADQRLNGSAMSATRFSLIDERPLLGDFVRNEALRPEAETLASACANRLPQATACPAHLVGKRQGRPGERFLLLAAPYAGLLCVGGRYAATTPAVRKSTRSRREVDAKGREVDAKLAQSRHEVGAKSA